MFYIDHDMIFGLSTAGGHQGEVADATVDICESRDIGPMIKWVDDFNVFRFPIAGDGIVTPFIYAYDLASMKDRISDLNVPWHPNKGQDFKDTVVYVGFLWDLPARTVSLTENKRFKFKRRFNDFLRDYRSNRISEKEVLKLSGSLSHIAFVYTSGRSYLSSLYTFSASFVSKFRPRWVPASVLSDLAHWSKILDSPFSWVLAPKRLVIDMDIWVDASTSWGISILIDGFWDAWRLVDGWRSPSRHIGWLEALAIELMALTLEAMGIRDAEVVTCSDNTGVIDAFGKGRGRNFMINLSIRRTDLLLVDNNLSLSLHYVESKDNLADPISRGVLGPKSLQSPYIIALPEELHPFLVHA